MNVRIRYNNLIRQLLPAYKRQANRLTLLRALIFPLKMLFVSFDQWRKETRMLVNVNSQTGVLQGYLREKYENDAITVRTFRSGGLAVGLAEEGVASAVGIGLESDPAQIPLEGELRNQFGEVDFIVYVPDGVDIERVRADVERYKLAMITFKIQVI